MKNNNEKFENFIRDFDTIRMTQQEKKDMRNNLVLFTTSYISKPSPYFKYISFFKKTIAVTLVILLIVSISKTASAKSLPGELLYNVKIIHEEIESAIINQPEKKVNFEIERTKTRIQEAVTLVKNNNLDKVKQEKIAKNIKKHVKNVSEDINSIKKKDPEKALVLNSNLKTTLKVNSKALEKAVKETENRSIVEEKKIDIQKQDDNYKEKKELDIININNEKTLNKKNDNSIDEITIDKKNTITTITNENTQEDAVSDEPKLDKNKVNYDDTKNNSIGNIILNSISEDIAKTEDVSNKIEDEIISEESDDINKNIQNDIKESEDIIDKQQIRVIQSEENNIVVNNIKPDENLLNNEKNNLQNDKIDEKTDTSKNIEISDNIRSEIVSLEHVLEAEQRLKLLLEDTSKDRDEDEIKIIKELIEEKRLGQAYVEIQKEIEIITEKKLLKELGMAEESQTEKTNENSVNDVSQIDIEKTQN